MLGTSDHAAQKRRTARVRAELWKRIGAFVRARREELGLSQGDIIQTLGYKSRNAVSNIEVGIEGLPPKRAYAWADVLELPRDIFFQFVTGEIDRIEVPSVKLKQDAARRLTAAERTLLATYRKLPPKYQRRLREQAGEYTTLSRRSKGGVK